MKVRYFRDKSFSAVVYIFGVLAVMPLFLVFAFIFSKGIMSINFDFFTKIPLPPGEIGGGIANALLGTVELIFIASLISVPIGVCAGTFLSEYKDSKMAHILGLAIEMLNGLPSIVIGIVVYSFVVKNFGGFSAISGGIALGILMLPVIARSTEETLKMLSKSLHEASLALGASYGVTLFRAVLPAGLSGIIAGILVSVARAAGETAPLLFTAFGNPFVNLDPTEPVYSLPVLIYQYAISPYDEWHALAWGAACVLLIMVLSLNLVAKKI
ncbi:phosphate transport system permease protein PstA [Fibrobacterales bacterium]|nr:phosphate transport system permease protein PstA [Fibrobacterales bacterium]